MFSFTPSEHKNGGWDSTGALVSENGWGKCYRQGIPEWRRPMWRRQRNGTTYGQGRQWQGGCFMKAIKRDLMIREVRDIHAANWSWKGWIFLNDLACGVLPAVAGNKTPENKTCSFTENPPLASHKADRSHQECFPLFQWALERS